MRRLYFIAVLLLAAALLAAPAFAQDQTIADILTAAAAGDNPEFTTLLAALQAANPALLEALSDPDVQVTMFAPTDAAFAAQIEKWGEDGFAALLADQNALTFILTFHVMNGAVQSSDIAAAIETAAAGGHSAWVTTLNGQYADLAEEDGLTYINGAALNADMTDIQASNGVIHVVDALLLPEPRTLGQMLADPDTAAQYGLTTFATALAAADPALLTALNDAETPLTVFAPTDDAFAVLAETMGEEAYNALLADPVALTDILAYHVFVGVLRSGDLSAVFAENDGTVVASTASSDNLTLTLTDEGVTINDARLLTSDIDAQNGVIHTIDAVLVPPSAQ